MTKISTVYKIIRPVNFLITFFSILVGAIICSTGIFPIVIILCAALSGATAAASGNVINDIFDIQIDNVNRPDRPLPKGNISIKEALILYITLLLISLISACIVSLNALIIDISALVLLFLYSYKFKKVILLSNFIVAFLTGLAFIYGGIAVYNFKAAIIPALFAFLINFIREIVKDMEDIKGDIKSGVSSFPHRYGFSRAKLVITVLSLLLIAATFYPSVTRIYSIEYLLIIVVIVDPFLIYNLILLFKDDSPLVLNKVSFILKLNMVFGLAAIYLGR